MKDPHQVKNRLARLGIHESDLLEKFILGGGAGGQKINKTASTVYLKHLPSGLEIKCQDTRFQAQNRVLARERLCERLEAIRAEAAERVRAAFEKKKRQNRKRSKKHKAVVLKQKKHRSEVKKNRQKFRFRDSDG